ncbi:hypothetical protein [Streptomyces sp. BE147]|uniref:hypothetical protein n=1 Tax=unclassified Streptomyces TaxID=2593676 RepID=UPI002E797FA8|nr:hypothetical protein [Streptomyces sp. BE147]MEE1738331.1 hypothetical protein [Streptomyces sp. BE147]
MKRLWVDPPVRGRGVASALVEGAPAHAARSGGGHRLRPSVWSRHRRHRAARARAGFTAAGSWTPGTGSYAWSTPDSGDPPRRRTQARTRGPVPEGYGRGPRRRPRS